MESYRFVCLLFAVTHFNHFFPEQLEQDFPFWKHLHGFWQTLPNFNLYTALSEPGQDLAADALTLIQGRGQEKKEDGFSADDSQIGTDDGEGDGSTKHSSEQVHC